MTSSDTLFLQILNCALRGQAFKEEVAPTAEEIKALLTRAEEHKVLPLVFDTIYPCKFLQVADKEFLSKCKQRSLDWVIRQLQQTNESLNLIEHLQQNGLDPIVMKGMVCRELYPKPYLRYSVDEDFLIQPEQIEQYHQLLLAEGMYADRPDANLKEEYELSYHKEKSPLYIELHKSPFPTNSGAFDRWNTFYYNAFENSVQVKIQDLQVRTLEPTEHLLFLILHAFKHFLFSGFGIRQVCDILVFAEKNGEVIDWKKVMQQCREVKANLFGAAIFNIGLKYLGFDAIKAHFPNSWENQNVDEEPLLTDILIGGLYGISQANRVHSSNITLNAVEGKKRHTLFGGILHSLFPPMDYMRNLYPYLKRLPFLLPLAWCSRIVQYLYSRKGGSNAMDSVRIGKERLALLKKYEVI